MYEDSDVFIHHPLYHPGPFEIVCRSNNTNAINEQGMWSINVSDVVTNFTFNAGSVFLNNTINALATLRGEGLFRQATLRIDQPIEGNFTCIINNTSHTIRVLTGMYALL